VAVADGRISWVGRAADTNAPPGERRDLGPGILTPGLVNAHCHLELSHLQGTLGRDHGFTSWVEELVGRRRAAGVETVRTAVADAVRRLVECGTAAVGDVSNTLAHVDLLAASALDAVVFHELLGWDPAAASTVLEREETLLAEARGRIAVRARAGSRIRVETAPELFRAVARRGGPAALHLAESADEALFLRSGSGPWREFLERRGLGRVAFAAPGTSPVRYADSLQALHSRLVAAHCVQVDREDVALLARRGVHVALCPRSNRNLGLGPAPVPDLVAADVALCLGTDSLASVDSLDVADDMAALHREHRSLEPWRIVEMATRGGARALGFTDLGELAAGCRARLAFAEAGAGVSDPLRFLVGGEARFRRVGP
jgi:cytosine/adenosine deaminase-related metal-dependent hydrolase